MVIDLLSLTEMIAFHGQASLFLVVAYFGEWPYSHRVFALVILALLRLSPELWRIPLMFST